MSALVETSAGYTGAEIEASIGDSLYIGFDEDREIDTGDLLQAIASRVPLTATMKEQIDDLTRWAATRAKPASSPIAPAKVETSRTAGIDL